MSSRITGEGQSRPPRPALILGFAGLIPFLWGAATLLSPPLAVFGAEQFGTRFVGPFVQISYGVIILSFMSGVLWGFATRTHGRLARNGYAASVVPALWAFLFVGSNPDSAAWWLILGFGLILLIERWFARYGLTPAWWMPYRTVLTCVVVTCLAVGPLT
ncbi:MAG: DUF3429 domain-containing protein [Rhodobacter sp.]|nr:DUF3429 domain-containing protein [Rhodobacter sp.]